MELSKEIEAALEGERRWKASARKEDSGSYCEDPSRAWSLKARVWDAYEKLHDALLDVERQL